MSTGDILDRSVRLYRRHFLHNLAIVSLPYILVVPIWALLGTVAWAPGRLPWQDPAVAVALVLFGLAYIWLYFVSMGALTRSVSERFLGGTPTIRTAYAPVLRRSLSLVWAYLLITVTGGAVLGAGVAIFFTAFFVAQQFPTTGGYGAAVGVGLVSVVVLLLAVRIFLRSFLVTQVILIEGVRGWAAFRRSWALMRTCLTKAVLILLFSFVVAFVISLLFSFPAGLVTASNPGWPTAILGRLLESVGQILSAPIVMIAFTLLYYDSRIRQEAFDLEMMARDLRVAPERPAPAPIRSPVPAAQARPPVAAPSKPQAASPSRPPGTSRVCPQCGAQVPNILSTCAKCHTPVPFGPATR
ncbi:MAG: hypothetical protein A2W08_04785 [Candidatus Rokubacteria bacterium RBG_16_73_20]|nr:MAG: hypothetical protein A2W08_04785 [Candidatus Rokubacteria bacterium RBG_16_73_20]